MKITCPNCKAPIPGGLINVETDVAFCRNCDEAYSLSDLIAAGGDAGGFDLATPPKGAWFEETLTGWRIGASTRSYTALFLVPFMCVWSGFSLGGIYGSQIVAGKFNLLLSLFGIPFVLGTILFGSIAVMSVLGKVIVSVDRNAGTIFTGVGRIGWMRRFDWEEITRIEEDLLSYRNSGSSGLVISMVGKSRTKFGSMLSDERRFFLLQGLRKLLFSRKK